MRGPDIQVWQVCTSEDVARFLVWLDERLARREPLAIDTETTGLAWWEPGFTRLWQIGDRDSGWAIPVSWWGRVIHEAMRRITEAGTPVIFHNAKFDMHACEVSGWPVPAWSDVHDTAILLHLRRSDLPRSLKGKQTAALLGPWIFKGQGILRSVAKEKYGLKGSGIWPHIPVDEPAYWAYGVYDTVLTRLLFDELQPELAEFGAPYQREMHYCAIMHRAERRGLRVDERYTISLRAQFLAEERYLLLQLQAAGIENPNSNKQVIALLEEDYGFVPSAFTEKGNPALDKRVLVELARAGGMQAEVVERLIRYKRVVKWRSTYLDTFLNTADIHGYVHPSINTMAARTGRSSISDPALQTLPSGDPVIRRCLLPRHKGMDWYSLDYSNQEPRLLAYYGQSPALLAYFNDGDGTGSIHDFVAEAMFGLGYTKEQRSLAKVFGLSRAYGAGAEKMAVASGLPIQQVEKLLHEYDVLVGLKHLNDSIASVAQNRAPNPYIVTLGGRRSYSDEDKGYTLTNFLMQGSGADILKDAVIRLDLAGLADYINVPVHDELTFSFPKEEGQGMAQEARLLMEDVGLPLSFPVTVSDPGKSWGSAYE